MYNIYIYNVKESISSFAVLLVSVLEKFVVVYYIVFWGVFVIPKPNET